MLWSKQFFFFDGDKLLVDEHKSNPLHSGYRSSRTRSGSTCSIGTSSRCRQWEYPRYAAWDLAFHTLPLAIVDPDFAKEQMRLMLKACTSIQWPATGIRVEFQRREPAGACLGHALPASHRAGSGGAKQTWISSGGPSISLTLNFTWWRIAKTGLARTSLKEAFSALTTSACLTAAPRCRPVAT